MKKTRIFFLMILLPSLAHSAGTVVCKAPNVEDVVINFSELKRFGKAFNCIRARFVVDISGCAPDGAFALHAPTGNAEIVSVVDRWQDYMKHSGGIMSHYVTKNEIVFAAGWVMGEKGYQESWRFNANRLAGSAELTIGKKKVRYSCEKATRKF